MEIIYKYVHTNAKKIERATLKSLDGYSVHTLIVLLDLTASCATSFNSFMRQTLVTCNDSEE